MRHPDLENSESSLAKVAQQLLADVPLPPQTELRRELEALNALLNERRLSDAEFERLSYLIDEIEMANAVRWHAISDLARARGFSLRDLDDECETASNKALQAVRDNGDEAAYDDR